MSDRKSWELTPEQKKEYDENVREMLEKRKNAENTENTENTGEGEQIDPRERVIYDEKTDDDGVR